MTPDNTTVSVSVTNPGGNALVRQVKLTYSAQSANIFAGILGVASISLTGASVAKASIPPNIDFYLLLDNSPSMSLPATSDGISLMQTLTRSQYGGSGCAFACHQASTNNGDTIGNPCADGTMPGGETLPLDQLGDGDTAIFVRIPDERPDMLRWLADRSIVPGVEVEIIGRDPFGGPVRVRVASGEHSLGADLASVMRVESA